MPRADPQDPPGPSKAQLREALLAARRARPAEELSRARAAIRAAVLAQVGAAGWRLVACYSPLRTEPGSVELLDALGSPLVPVVLPDRDLDWREHGTDRLLGPEAIAAVDAAFVPALAVDRFATRLGRGGGSYDRALTRLPVGVPVVALLFESELVDFRLPREPWDVPVTAVVTPAGWHALDGK